MNENYINQPTDSLLYDLDLMPEQCKTKIDKIRSQAVINLKKQLEESGKIILLLRDSVVAGYNPKTYKSMKEYLLKYGDKNA